MSRPACVFPKVSSEKAATTAVRFGLCGATLSYWGTEPHKQSSLLLRVASSSCHNRLLLWLFSESPDVTQITFFYPRIQNWCHNYSRTVGTLDFVALWGRWVLPLHSRSFWGLRWWICVSLSLWIPGTWFYSPLIHCTLKRVLLKHWFLCFSVRHLGTQNAHFVASQFIMDMLCMVQMNSPTRQL